MTPDEARRQALIRFGGLEGVRESTRDEIRPALLEDSVRDRPPRRSRAAAGARLHRRGAGDAGPRHRRDLGDLQRGPHGDAGAAAVPRARSDRGGVGNQPRRHGPERDRPRQLRRLARAHANARASGHGGSRWRRHDHQRPACSILQGSPSRPTSFARWASSRRSAAPTPPRKTSAAATRSSC